MILSVAWGVITRYITAQPATWAGELAVIAFAWVVFLGASACFKYRLHASIDMVTALLPDGGRAVDLCTGSGAVAAHLAREVPTATVIGVDVDPRAAANARGNGVVALIADLAAPFGPTARFDVVTAVAPYVPTEAIGLLPADVRAHEPRLALDGGPDGLDLVRRVVAAAGTLLRPGGWLMVEVGGDQDHVLAPGFASAGFGRVDSWADEDGDLRRMSAQRT